METSSFPKVNIRETTWKPHNPPPPFPWCRKLLRSGFQDSLMWKPQGNFRFPTRKSVGNGMETSGFLQENQWETAWKHQVSYMFPHDRKLLYSSFQVTLAWKLGVKYKSCYSYKSYNLSFIPDLEWKHKFNCNQRFNHSCYTSIHFS